MRWWLYSAGSFGWSMINMALVTMLFRRYDPGPPGVGNPLAWPLLLSSAWVGIAMLSGRIVDAVADPLVGYWSDHSKARMGRRRSYMALGVVPMLLAFVLVFTPPVGRESFWNLAYLVAILGIYFFAFTLYVGPYLAWLPELERDTERRIHLSTLMAVFSLLGTGCGAIAAPALAPSFGFFGMALVMGGFGLVTCLLPLGVAEDPKAAASQTASFPFFEGLRLVWKNEPFRPYLIGQVLTWIAVNIVMSCNLELVAALMHKPTEVGAIVSGLALGGALVGFAPLNLAARRLGKRLLYELSMFWLGGSLLLIWPVSVVFGTAALVWYGLFFFLGLSLAAVFILPNAMLADIIDLDEKATGQRREALYFGFQGLILKAGIGLSSLTAGFVLLLGKKPEAPLGVQMTFTLAGVFALLAALIMRRYPLKG